MSGYGALTSFGSLPEATDRKDRGFSMPSTDIVPMSATFGRADASVVAMAQFALLDRERAERAERQLQQRSQEDLREAQEKADKQKRLMAGAAAKLKEQQAEIEQLKKELGHAKELIEEVTETNSQITSKLEKIEKETCMHGNGCRFRAGCRAKYHRVLTVQMTWPVDIPTRRQKEQYHSEPSSDDEGVSSRETGFELRHHPEQSDSPRLAPPTSLARITPLTSPSLLTQSTSSPSPALAVVAQRLQQPSKEEADLVAALGQQYH